MSMWDWDEEGESDDRQQYRNPNASSSNYHGGYGGHQSHSDHSHHHHDHAGHQHHHGHAEQDDAHSYHGHQSGRASPSRQNYGALHESYADQRDRQNYGQNDSYENRGHHHDSYASSNMARGQNDSYENRGHHHDSYASSNMARAPPVQSSQYGGYDMNAGYEIREEHRAPPPSSGHGHEASNRTDLFTSDSVVNLTLDEIDALARTHRSRAWLVVLYAPWCRFCQAMEPNFERVARYLENSDVYVGRFRSDGDYKEYAKRYLQLEHFPTILFFPKDSLQIVKYQSENREVDALLGFVQAFE